MPAPRIIYEGDEAAAHQHLTVAQNLLHKVRSMAAASGAGVIGQSFAPDPSSFIYALKIGDTEVLHIFSAPETAITVAQNEFTTLPDFMSGAVREPRIKTITLPGGAVRVVLDSYRPTTDDAKVYKLDNGFQPVPRLAVKPHKTMRPDAPPWLSQFGPITPSAYSGRMRKLVQVLLGYGRIPSYTVDANDKWGGEVRGQGLQIQYDGRFQRTHIITEAEDKRLWLVEISISNGVLAVQLPVYQNSRYLEKSKRESIAEAAKLFKGLPTGRPFPTGKELQALLKSGEVLRLAEPEDLQPYARLSPFSTAMGWCANDKGTEAHNTGYYMHEDNIYRACHYSLQIEIGALKQRRRPNEPIADGSAVLKLVSEGKFYHPSKRLPPPIKFYEPLIGGLLSVEFLSAFGADTSVEALPLMDTTMHVFYSDNQLKKVNYFWDRREKTGTETVKDTRDDCMLVGAWTYREETNRSVPPTFYTTDDDDRRKPENSYAETNWTGRDLGYWVYKISDDPGRWIFPQWSSVWRDRVFRVDSETIRVNDKTERAAVLIPQGTRDGCVYANIEYSGSKSRITGTQYKSLRDPNNYYSYRFFYDDYETENECWVQDARKVREVYYTIPNSTVSGGPIGPDCYELVDKGPWLEICDPVDNLPQGIGVPRDFTGPNETTPMKITVTAKLYIDDEFDRVLTLEPAKENADIWVARSPDPDFPDIVQQFSAVHSVFSRSQQAVYHKTINGERARRGSLVGDSTNVDHTFLGYT